MTYQIAASLLLHLSVITLIVSFVTLQFLIFIDDNSHLRALANIKKQLTSMCCVKYNNGHASQEMFASLQCYAMFLKTSLLSFSQRYGAQFLNIC